MRHTIVYLYNKKKKKGSDYSIIKIRYYHENCVCMRYVRTEENKMANISSMKSFPLTKRS